MERSFCLLALIFCNIFGADFVFSAQISTKNNVLEYEKINISPLMSREYKKITPSIYHFNSQKPKNQSEHEYLKSHEDELYNCFMTQSVKVYGKSEMNLLYMNANTQLFFNPVRFNITFNANGADIYLLKSSF